MTLSTWWIFVGTVFLLSGTPGPNMLYVLSRSMEMGMRRSVAAMAGCLTAILLILAASAAGLSTLLLALPAAFEIIRYGGAAYLVFLGIQAWRTRPAQVTADPPSGVSSGVIFRDGFTIGVSNPKLILFAAAFLPQFINPARPHSPQFVILVSTFAVIETFWYAIYAFGGRSLSRYVSRPEIKRTINRATGLIFIGFGLALLKTKPS